MRFAFLVDIATITLDLSSRYSSRQIYDKPSELLVAVVETKGSGHFTRGLYNIASNIFFTAIATDDTDLFERACKDLCNFPTETSASIATNETCFRLAIEKENLQVLAKLVERQSVTHNLQEALKMAAEKPECMNLLFRTGWILASAVQENNLEYVAKALADPENKTDYVLEYSLTPLQMAIVNKNYEIVRLLTKRNTFDRNPLLFMLPSNEYASNTAKESVTTIIRHLIVDCKCDPHEPFEWRCYQGILHVITPLAFAVLNWNDVLFELLMDCGVTISPADGTRFKHNPSELISLAQLVKMKNFKPAMVPIIKETIEATFEGMSNYPEQLGRMHDPFKHILVPYIVRNAGFELTEKGWEVLNLFVSSLFGIARESMKKE